jgi:hypothetical protein
LVAQGAKPDGFNAPEASIQEEERGWGSENRKQRGMVSKEVRKVAAAAETGAQNYLI